MLDGIKNFFEGPKDGVKNITEVGEGFKPRGMKLIIFVIGVLLVIGVIKKIFSFFTDIFRK